MAPAEGKTVRTASPRSIRRAGLLAALAAMIVFALPSAAVAADEAHSLIRYWLETEADQQFFAENQARWDVVTGRAGRFADVVVPRDELGQWLTLGSRVEVVEDHLEAFYAARNGSRDNFGD